MTKKKHLIVIGGPTAVGKTEVSIRLALALSTEIISADSRQFYREMTIGTAKPSAQQLSMVKHHFIDHLSIHEPYSVGDFERDALQCLSRLYQKYDSVVLVGGSGLYIRALCEGLDHYPEVPLAVRQAVEELYRAEGLGALQAALQRADPEYYKRVDQQNPHRLIRALAVYRASGRPFSAFQRAGKKQRPFLPVYIKLQLPRPLLYQRINERVDQMVQEGLIGEARSLLPHAHLNALQTVGYQELFDHLQGKITLEAAIEKIKRNSRRYAKRQETWFRKDPHWEGFNPHEEEKIRDYIINTISK